jgi:hypothetical protein
MGKSFSIDGKSYANLATSNFLCFVGNEQIEVTNARNELRRIVILVNS